MDEEIDLKVKIINDSYQKSRVCRLCLGNDATLNIFDEKLLLNEKIPLCCTLEIFINDGLPDNVCAMCVGTINTAVKFRNQCEENDKVLRKMLLPKKEIKTEIHIKNEEDVEFHDTSHFSDDDHQAQKLEVKAKKKKTKKAKKKYDKTHNENKAKKKRDKINNENEIKKKHDKTNNENMIDRQDTTNNENKLVENNTEIENKIYDKTDNVSIEISKKTKKKVTTCKRKDPELIKLERDLRPFLKKKRDPIARKGFSECGGLCPFCGKVYTIMSSYNIHIKKHITPETEYCCTTCPKKFREIRNLKDHEKTHLKIRDYSCEVCGKLFGTKSDAKKHLERVHERSKVVNCKICNKELAHQNSLKCHMKVHTGEREYECDVCEKKFAFKCSLSIHMRCHTGEKPYACKFCDSKFAAMKTIKEHERLHTGETPYVCPVCDKGFTQKSNMKSHFRNNHKGIEFKPGPPRLLNNPDPVCKFWGPRC